MSCFTLTELRADPGMLGLVPPEEQTEALCLAAVESDGSVLRYVHRQTPTICLAAVQSYCWALEFVEPRFQTPGVCRAALSVDGGLLGLIRNPSADICRFAVEQNGEAILFVPYQTPELSQAAVQNTPFALKHIQSQTVSLCQAAVRVNSHALRDVKLPMDRLIDPASEQLQDWCQVLSACVAPSRAELIIPKLRELVYAMPLGEKYRQKWLHPTRDGGLMLDRLAALMADMIRLAPDDKRIEQFHHAVNRQTEWALARACQPAGQSAQTALKEGPQPAVQAPDASWEGVL